MKPLTNEHAAAFFRRSYTAVDGLWFIKIEEALGFDQALELDVAVWQIMPKIQARELKAMTGQTTGLAALEACFTAKLHWEEYDYESTLSADGARLEIAIRDCPWRRLMAKAGREHLAERVAMRICTSEYAIWAAEFSAQDAPIRYELAALLCRGDPACVLRFST